MIDDVFTIAVDGEGVADSFVEGALPPFIIRISVPAESYRGELVAVHSEDADLLAREAGKGLCATGGKEIAVVCVHDGVYMELPMIEGHQGYVT